MTEPIKGAPPARLQWTSEQQRKINAVIHAASDIAEECQSGAKYPPGAVVRDGVPCCVFGHILTRAGYKPHTPTRAFNDLELSRFLFGVEEHLLLGNLYPEVADAAEAIGAMNDAKVLSEIPGAIRRFAESLALAGGHTVDAPKAHK